MLCEATVGVGIPMDHYVKIFFDNAHCVASFTLLSQRTILLHTRMHSGRMRTARSSSCPERRGLHSPWEQTPLPGSRPPQTRHPPWTRPPLPGTPGPDPPPRPDTPLDQAAPWTRPPYDQAPPPPETEFLTHASETRMHPSRMQTGCSLTVCQGGAWSQGGCLVQGVHGPGGVHGPEGAWSRGMCLVPGGSGIPACTEADPPPVNRITHTSKNITLATTSLRPVNITLPQTSFAGSKNTFSLIF